MIWVYIASAVFGGAFVIPMFLGGLDFDTGVDIDGGGADIDGGLDTDFDTDFGDMDGAVDGAMDIESASDVGPDIDVTDLSSDGLYDSVGEFASSLLSFRSLVFAMTFFGLSGAVFTWLGANVILALAIALCLAFFAASLNSVLMQFVNRKEVSSHVTNADMRGTNAEVVLPVAAGRKGRIRAIVAGQTQYFVALPFGSKHNDHSFEAGDPVVVVDIQGGTALISPMKSLES